MPTVITAVVVPYPGKSLKAGSPLKESVAELQTRLNERGCGPIKTHGRFDAATEAAVRRFQLRFPDAIGQPLTVDGVVGPITWEALFGASPTPPITTLPSSLATAALAWAVDEIGQMENPPGSNRGERIDDYARAVGLRPESALPWCAAFVYWCFTQAAQNKGVPNPVVRTAGVLDHWTKAGARGVHRVLGSTAKNSPELVQPGFIFIMDFGGGAGHTGFVESVAGGRLVTIEGNTNDGGSREGVGVFRRESRKISSINKGFLDYS
jgi:peptidoglycan hydrolase-like protein with peptidoglycan-binding domain